MANDNTGTPPAKQTEKPDPALQQGVSDIKRHIEKGDLHGGEQHLSHVFATWMADHKGQDPREFWKFMESDQGLGDKLLQLSLAYADDKSITPGLTGSNPYNARDKRIDEESVTKHESVVASLAQGSGNKTEGRFAQQMDEYLKAALKTDAGAQHGWNWGPFHPDQYYRPEELDLRVSQLNAENAGATKAQEIAARLAAPRADGSTLFAQMAGKNGYIDSDAVTALHDKPDGLSADDKAVVNQLYKYYQGLGPDRDDQVLKAAVDSLGGSRITKENVDAAAELEHKTRDQKNADRAQQNLDIYRTLSNVGQDTAGKLFKANGNDLEMTPDSVKEALKDPTLSKSDRDTLSRLAEQDNWPDWARNPDGSPKPIKLGDVLRSAGTNQDGTGGNDFTTDGKPDSPIDMNKVRASQTKTNADIAAMFKGLGNDLDPNNTEGIWGRDGKITHDTIQTRLQKVDSDPNAKTEAAALRALDANFNMISKNGTTIDANELSVFAANHKPPESAPPAQPGAGALTDEQIKAQDEAWKKIDEAKAEGGVDRLQHGETLYAFAQRHLGPNAGNKEIFTWLNEVMGASGFRKANLDPNKTHYTQHDLPGRGPGNWNSITYHTDLHIPGGTAATPEQQHQAREEAGLKTLGPADGAAYLKLTDDQTNAIKGLWAQQHPNEAMPDPRSLAFAVDKAAKAQGKTFLTQEQIEQAQKDYAAAKQAMEARLQAHEAQLANPGGQPAGAGTERTQPQMTPEEKRSGEQLVAAVKALFPPGAEYRPDFRLNEQNLQEMISQTTDQNAKAVLQALKSHIKDIAHDGKTITGADLDALARTYTGQPMFPPDQVKALGEKDYPVAAKAFEQPQLKPYGDLLYPNGGPMSEATLRAAIGKVMEALQANPNDAVAKQAYQFLMRIGADFNMIGSSTPGVDPNKFSLARPAS